MSTSTFGFTTFSKTRPCTLQKVQHVNTTERQCIKYRKVVCQAYTTKGIIRQHQSKVVYQVQKGSESKPRLQQVLHVNLTERWCVKHILQKVIACQYYRKVVCQAHTTKGIANQLYRRLGCQAYSTLQNVQTAALAQWVRVLAPQAECQVLESQLRQTQVVKTGRDSSTAKPSAIGASVMGPQR